MPTTRGQPPNNTLATTQNTLATPSNSNLPRICFQWNSGKIRIEIRSR